MNSAGLNATNLTIIDLKYFKNLIIKKNDDGSHTMIISTNGKNCIIKLLVPSQNFDQEQESSDSMSILFLTNMELEANLETRLNKAFNDLKKFYGGIDKY